MHSTAEYDPVLHAAARQTSLGVLRHWEESPYGDSAPTRAEVLLAQMYLDLLERRGTPPSNLKGYPSIQLVTGNFFDFLNPDSTPVNPEVIARAGSKICRCTGQILGDEIYSIIQHMCHASDAAPKPLKFKALMHDAHEVVVGDMATPLKMICPDYKIVETRAAHSFARTYSLPLDFESEVKEIDLRMAATEKRDIMPPGEWKMLAGIEPYDFRIVPWSPQKSYQEWLLRFYPLFSEHLAQV